MCVCLSVNQGGTIRNHCTQRLEILHAQLMNHLRVQKNYASLTDSTDKNCPPIIRRE